MESVSLVAITRRICEVGSSRNGEAPTTVDGANELGRAAGRCGPLNAVSMSRFIMRPFGPEPTTDRRSIELSAAIRAAMGETNIRPVVAALPFVAADTPER